MKQSVLDGNLQILLRSQQKPIEDKTPRKQDAISCFFDPKPCDDMYPQEVECKKTGTWTLVDKGSQLQPDRKYKVWAMYTRELPTKEELPDVATAITQ